MQRFLESCAAYIYDNCKESFRDICLVFPNRRAGVFFTSYLKDKLELPVIGPKITTVNELMLSFSELMPADRLKLNSLLYLTHRNHTGRSETFDDFWFWGEILLDDFDDIDKYRADATDLFRNLSDLKELERHFDYLSAEQKKMLEQFWGSLHRWEEYGQERDFMLIWEKLALIYHDFREKLANEGVGYEGMLIRDGTDRLISGAINPTCAKYLFIGLNALNPCEKRVFSFLQETGRAMFFWDYDDYYLNDPKNNAGKFIRENLVLFPSPAGFTHDTQSFSHPKTIERIAVPSGFGQAQTIPAFLNKFSEAAGEAFDETAVVLADESLLFPVLGAIPENRAKVNFTMGYPLKNAPIVNLIFLIADLLKNSRTEKEPRLYFRLVTAILSHPLLSPVEPEKVAAGVREFIAENRVYLTPGQLDFSELHRKIFNPASEVKDYTAYFLGILRLLYDLTGDSSASVMLREMMAVVYASFEKLGNAVTELSEKGGIEISPAIYIRLMRQYLNRLSAPFEGEPLSGLQVMGILETRCIDFNHLLIIGFNEDIWPRPVNTPSMIPVSIRKAFGLPGPDDQDSMYAYYFYRLIQRASRITMTWNPVRDGLSGGELSRYAYQLEMLSPHKVNIRSQTLPLIGISPAAITVKAGGLTTDDTLQTGTSDHPLSPSAIITYLTCSLRFYFRYIAGLKEPDEVKEEIDRQSFGNIFHKAIELLYLPLTGKWNSPEVFGNMLSNRQLIRECVLQAITTEYFNRKPEEWINTCPEGKAALIESTLQAYIQNMLESDRRYAPFFIHSLETGYSAVISLPVDGSVQKIHIGGKIDRIDEKEGKIRVVDYKTGFVNQYDLSVSSVEGLFDPDKKQIKKEALQALLYSYILKHSRFPAGVIYPAVIAVMKLRDESFDPIIKTGGNHLEISQAENALDTGLKSLLSALYSKETVFSQTSIKERCRYCPYTGFCGR